MVALSRVLLQSSSILMIIFSFCLFITACVVTRQCYVDPCYEGDGMEQLWRVSDGDGFQTVLLSVLLLIGSFTSFFLLFRSPTTTKMQLGAIVAGMALLAFMMLMFSVTWGVKANMLEDLDSHVSSNNGPGYFYQSNSVCAAFNTTTGDNKSACEKQGKHCQFVVEQVALDFSLGHAGCYRAMKVNTDATERFGLVMAFSIVLLLTMIGFSCGLMITKNSGSVDV